MAPPPAQRPRLGSSLAPPPPPADPPTPLVDAVGCLASIDGFADAFARLDGLRTATRGAARRPLRRCGHGGRVWRHGQLQHEDERRVDRR
jgi:hypothetical protein